MSRTTTVHFPEIVRGRVVLLRCRCGRPVRRTVKVMNTINPFNKDEQGQMKTYQRVEADVLSALKEKVDLLKAEGLQCRHCASNSALAKALRLCQ